MVDGALFIQFYVKFLLLGIWKERERLAQTEFCLFVFICAVELEGPPPHLFSFLSWLVIKVHGENKCTDRIHILIIFHRHITIDENDWK